MGRIADIFENLRSEERKAIMPFVVAGDPSGVPLGDVLLGAQRGGASVVEIGIPFSDPIADGPVIAAAMDRSLRAGMTPEAVFQQVASVRDQLKTGVVAMVSVSLVHAAGGPEKFIASAVASGFDGFIFPDAPLEESGELLEAADRHDASASLLVAPSTPDDRARQIGEACRGFVYLLARAGITGERTDMPDPADLARRARIAAGGNATPVAVGFGISTPEHVRSVVEHADAAIVGSALVRRLHDAGPEAAIEVERFVADLASGLTPVAADGL